MNAPAGQFARVARDVRPERMAALPRLPVFLALEDRLALVAGGSPAAAWKAELLCASGANVHVYAARACDELLSLVAAPPRGALTLHGRKWNPVDLGGCALAVGDCDNDSDAAAFAAAARNSGVPVNVIDKPAFCDFAFGAIVNRAPLVIGISTDGAAPVFAQAVRARLEMLLPRGFARWAAAAARWRSAVKAAGLTFAGRRKFWRLFSAHALLHPEREPDAGAFESFLAQLRAGARDRGSVTLIATDCGDPELLTLRALRALQSADVILFDNLVPPEVHEFARREAKKIRVAHNAFGASGEPGDVKAFTIDLAERGKHVVRLTAGDPMVLGRTREEAAAWRAAGVAIEIVPAIALRPQSTQADAWSDMHQIEPVRRKLSSRRRSRALSS